MKKPLITGGLAVLALSAALTAPASAHDGDDHDARYCPVPDRSYRDYRGRSDRRSDRYRYRYDDRRGRQHARLHRRLEDAHERAHDRGFRNRREHRRWHERANEYHERAHDRLERRRPLRYRSYRSW